MGTEVETTEEDLRGILYELKGNLGFPGSLRMTSSPTSRSSCTVPPRGRSAVSSTRSSRFRGERNLSQETLKQGKKM